MIHKRILDVADSKPDASMEEIADSISGASTDLVDRVLEEYGDPVESEGTESDVASTDEPATPDAPDPGTGTDGKDQVGEQRPELSRKQLETLRLVQEDPGASQGELTEAMGVTRATISRWLDDIPGFEWTNREAIAAAVPSGDEGRGATATGRVESDGEGGLDALERKVERLERDHEVEPPGIDPELVHKVVHASMASDQITEEEELRLLRALMG